ncbi:unnamed protein product [Peronospora belbahrii]|nr:unnamed protein product [Peronospora belbahrii]
MSIVHLFANKVHSITPEELDAAAQSLMVKDLPSGVLKERQYKCIGWRATADCRPDGVRDLANDKSCDQRIMNGASGYCEIEDVESGQRFRVMQRGCSTVKKGAKFFCSDAPDFANFHIKGSQIVEKAIMSNFSLPNVKENAASRAGIVMVVHPKVLASAYASIRTLREVLNCQLPIEIWFRSDEMQGNLEILKPLQETATKDAVDRITFREITDERALRFATKVYAIYNSAFDQVLFLDSDNVPVRDPTFLFESEEFVRTGAVFWPDFWHPKHTIFHIVKDSLLWQMLDMEYVDMFEQESGQVLIDRRRHAAAMELVNFYTFHVPNHFSQLKLVFGDKDLFRCAWIKLNVPFFMVQSPPAIAGKVVNEIFCGMTTVQYDSAGNILFLHRNANKLTGQVKREKINYEAVARKQARFKLQDQGLPADLEDMIVQTELDCLKQTPAPTLEPREYDNLPDPVIWTHLYLFRNSSSRVDYRIKTYRAKPDFPARQSCYGLRNINKINEHFYFQKVADLNFPGLETHLRRFAMEGAQLLDNYQVRVTDSARV